MVYTTRCQICGADLTRAGFYRCDACKGCFCKKHKRPEDHNCSELSVKEPIRKPGFLARLFGKKQENQEVASSGLRRKQRLDNKKQLLARKRELLDQKRANYRKRTTTSRRSRPIKKRQIRRTKRQTRR